MKYFLRRLFPDKEQREYNKMYRRHRKELVKLAKQSRDFDWGYLHDLVMMKIRHMYEYYVENNNVWQADEKRLMVIDQMQHVLDLDRRIDEMQTEDRGYRCVRRADGSATYEFDDDYGERVAEWEERRQSLYEELYGSIGKNLRWWWD